MRRTAITAAATGLAVALAAAPPALSQHPGEMEAAAPIPVSIGFSAVAPQHLDVLPGDTVRWTNNSVRTHTVTADDGAFDSGRIVPSATFTRTFTAFGDVPYHCVLHPFIRGDVSVNRLLLTAPAQPAASNRPFPLTGRAALPAGASVTVEADRGAGFTPVTVLVLDRTIALRVRREGRRLRVSTSVSPASAGAPVVLQLFLHEHFGWWPVQRGKLDRASTARFALRLRRRVAARVLLTLPDGATPLAISRTLRIGPTR